MDEQQIRNNFTYHEPIKDQSIRYGRLRNYAREMAEQINQLCPESREKSLAFTNLEQALMWANASIARNETE
ncbi:MAG TPA: hypothetical protein PLR83_00345 [Pyrinomonadaceae bacterium]|nr:hypothetical protein [Pyrinomonadaceae bacterium]